jgi:hypothetical protein
VLTRRRAKTPKRTAGGPWSLLGERGERGWGGAAYGTVAGGGLCTRSGRAALGAEATRRRGETLVPPSTRPANEVYVTREAKAGAAASASASQPTPPIRWTPAPAPGFLSSRRRRRNPGARPGRILKMLRAGGRGWPVGHALISSRAGTRRGPWPHPAGGRRPADWVRLGWFGGLLRPGIACDAVRPSVRRLLCSTVHNFFVSVED